MAAIAADLVARKVGEGHDRPTGDSELPIDINYQKVIEWMVSRQKLPKDWHKRLQVIHAKAADAAKELPPDLPSRLPGGRDAPLDYFRCVAVRDTLAETAERTLFGGLAGPAATWDKIVKAYEKDLVYVGEACQAMVQNVDYELPYLRKSAAKFNQQITDLERKAAECVKGAAACATSYAKECAKLGIAPAGAGAVGAAGGSGTTGSGLGATSAAHVRQEVQALVRQLPALFSEAVLELHAPQLGDAMDYYTAWCAYAHKLSASGTPASCGPRGGSGSDSSAAGGAANTSGAGLLPTLQEVRAGKALPPAAALMPAAAVEGAGGVAAGEGPSIDWDLGMAAPAPTGEAAVVDISWDIDVGMPNGERAAASGGGEAPAISWDFDLGADTQGADDAATAAPLEVAWDIDVGAAEDSLAAATGSGGADATVTPGAINWDIDMTDSGADRPQTAALEIDWEVVPEAAGEEEHSEGATSGPGAAGTSAAAASALEVAASPDEVAALRLERDAEYRSRLLDDLQELRAFLVQRRADMSSAGIELLTSALMPEALQTVDDSALAGWLAATNTALARFSDERLRQRVMIASSKRYLERLVGSLLRQSGQEAKLLAAAQDAEARKNVAKSGLVELSPKIGAIVERTRALKAAVERVLGGVLGGRTVNILGDINTAISSAVL